MAKEYTKVEPPAPAAAEDNEFGSKIATVAAIGVGAALIEAELIPGILIGIGAMLAPKVFPKLGNSIRPLVKGIVRAGYSVVDKSREMAAEAGEQFQDIVAEVKAESEAPAPAATGHGSNSGKG